MKVLDVKRLMDDTAKSRKHIDALQNQITATQKAVRQVTSLEDALKGKTGDAIRLFYQEAHQKFLIHLYEFLIDFENVLKRMERAVQSLEQSPKGRIEQGFIENDIDYGLQNVKNTTLNLTDDANHTIQSVRDIVALPQLNPEELIHRVRQGEKKTQQVIEQLYDFDQAQTKALQPLKQDIETMKRYISDMDKMIQNGSFSMKNVTKRMFFESDAYIEMTGADSIIQYVLKSFNLEGRLQNISNPVHQKNLEIVYETPPELKPLLDKLKNMFSYAAPLAVLLYPKSLFPITYRNHEPSNKPVNFDKLKETKTYQDLVMENAMSEEEIAAIRAHLNDVIENGSSSAYSPESYSGPDREEMTFWDKRKVLGGNSSLAGTPDGLAGPAIAVADFFTEDFGTLISEDATAGERGLALALLIPIVKPLRLLKPLDDVMSGGKTVGKGTGAKDFEKSLVRLPPAERVATVRLKAQEVARSSGLLKDSKLSKMNGRDVYKDPKTGDLYSVDTQHGRFEKANKKGKHLGEVDFDLAPTKPADASGGHNLKVK